ncbi:MAG TPA: ABC transporter substrate-binding protein [Casimicrobiaceae bacterium]|jgi:branched-chain amino acid transport system substrate-binding protein|nr:ABC transporter substrate-binding protein [Casimicrobiaceae bacterium]
MLKTWLARCALLLVVAAGPAAAQDTVRIGLILPMTGPFASTGRQIDGAVKLWMQEHGSTVAGKKIEVIVKDDAGTPDTTRRLAQELVNDKVNVLAGFGLTPLALATAPIATQAKVPMIVMAAATSSITEQSPMIVRSGFTLPQITTPMADWAAKNNIKKVITLVSDYGPGIDAENAFKAKFSAEGGQVTDSLRVPLRNPDFAPFLQKVKDEQPNAVFVFVPSGVGSIFAKQFVERGFDKSGVRLIATGDLTDDDILNDMGDVTLGVITSMHYSAAHPSAANKAYVEGFKKLNGIRPNFHSVGGYDGMRLIYMALEKTKGNTDGEALVNAMKGLQFESPRGPVTIDPATRDPIQNVYLRKVEKQNGELWNVEFSTVPAVKDPMHK